MKERKPSSAYITAKMLIAEGRFFDATEMLSTYISRIRAWEEWSELLTLLDGVPEEHHFGSSAMTIFYAEVLARNGQHDLLFEFTSRAIAVFDGETRGELLLSRFSGLFERGNFEGALLALEEAVPLLSGESRGRAFSRMGLTLFQMGKPWEEEFLRAREFLTGRAWGLVCLNFGYCLNGSHRSQEARALWIEALSLLKNDSYSLAWLRYNLGSSYLLDFEIVEAERHFLEGERLSRNSRTISMHHRILNGLASVRRVYGEWTRAEFTYREALRVAADSFDRVTALVDLARTLLLAGRATEASEVLEIELNTDDANNPIVHVARALVFLRLNDPARARRALGLIASPIVGTYQWLERIARAELARRDGQLTEAVNLLDGLPVTTLHPREEVRQWPELFTLLRVAGKPVPEPLEYVSTTVVRVTANGILRVTVNTRAVAIPPVGRAGELLVFLLEQGGAASLEVIRDALFPDALDADVRRANKTIWFHVESLRKAFGWASSVTALRGAYQLDPDVTWQYDITEARAHGAFRGEFLKGVYSDWVLEVGRELEALSGQDRDAFLN